MASIKDILKQYGIEEKIDEIESAIKGSLHEEYVPKKQYNKKVQALDKLQEKVDDLEAKGENNELQEKYNNLEKEYNDYKQTVETEKVNADKDKALVEALKTTGFSDSIVKLMQKQFDLSKLELEEGKIKDWDTLVAPFKEEYAGFISEEVEEGLGSVNPPTDNKGMALNIDAIKNMTTEQINENWEAVSKVLASNNN